LRSLFYHSAAHRPLISFPTRRSSDLDFPANGVADVFLGHQLGVEERNRRVGLLAVQQFDSLLGSHLGHAVRILRGGRHEQASVLDRKSTRLNSSHVKISYAVFCLKKK